MPTDKLQLPNQIFESPPKKQRARLLSQKMSETPQMTFDFKSSKPISQHDGKSMASTAISSASGQRPFMHKRMNSQIQNSTHKYSQQSTCLPPKISSKPVDNSKKPPKSSKSVCKKKITKQITLVEV